MDPFANEYSEVPWFNNRIYRRYWRHYERVMEWKRRHQLAYYKAQCAANEMENEALRNYFMQSVKTLNDWPQKQTHSNENHQQQEEEGEIQFEMEISDEMIAFLEKSDQHRRQLRAERKLEEARGSGPEGRGHSKRHSADVAPPSEQPGAKRTSEMKFLYGARAPMIHGMETAVQLSFNRNCDRFQPKLWPNMPIKLKFNSD